MERKRGSPMSDNFSHAKLTQKEKHFVFLYPQYLLYTWASAAGDRGAMAPSWIFIHGRNIVDRGLKELFFGIFFSVASLPCRGLTVLFFGLFCYFSDFFRLPPTPENFSADVLDCISCNVHLI